MIAPAAGFIRQHAQQNAATVAETVLDAIPCYSVESSPPTVNVLNIAMSAAGDLASLVKMGTRVSEQRAAPPAAVALVIHFDRRAWATSTDLGLSRAATRQGGVFRAIMATSTIVDPRRIQHDTYCGRNQSQYYKRDERMLVAGQSVDVDTVRTSVDNRPRVLLEFGHGLGDSVQLTSVLLHLQHYYPEWEIDVASLIGKHSTFVGLARKALIRGCDLVDHSQYDRVYSLDWWEPDSCYIGSPSTKAERCLREVFGVEPRIELCRYRIEVAADARMAAANYLDGIGAERGPQGRYKAVIIHYEGNTAIWEKNLTHETAKAICEIATKAGWTPVILDWDHRSPLPDGRAIFCPDAANALWKGYGTGDAERLAALIGASSLFVGVDSGPQKVAGATSTRSLGIWTRHHPIHYFAMADNFLHVCPEESLRLIRGNWQHGEEFFREHYHHVNYSNLTRDLLPIVEREMGVSIPRTRDFVHLGGLWVRSENISQDLLIVRDVYDHDTYRTKLQLPMLRSAEVIVDVGAHIGSFARLCHEQNPDATVICVEACPENVEALEMNVGEFAEVVHAACTYEEGPMALLNTVRPDCESTGSSVVVPLTELECYPCAIGEYRVWRDRRVLRSVTLEDIMRRFGCERINLLKLDCEGSEISILENTPSLDRIDFIMGEYHNHEEWESLRTRRFAGWDYGDMCRHGDSGIFHLRNPQR